MEKLKIEVRIQTQDGRQIEKEAWVIGSTGQTFVDRGEELMNDALIEAFDPDLLAKDNS